jgi:hypothetical protein
MLIPQTGKEGMRVARKPNGKLKILYVKDIFERELKEGQAVTMRELLERLIARGYTAERKSVADDIRLLRLYGIPIVCVRRGRATAYALKKTV